MLKNIKEKSVNLASAKASQGNVREGVYLCFFNESNFLLC